MKLIMSATAWTPINSGAPSIVNVLAKSSAELLFNFSTADVTAADLSGELSGKNFSPASMNCREMRAIRPSDVDSRTLITWQFT
ncbi:hypothetical protein SDC9_174766 [bioreactor metagenome]|uniref:Uncharacterized protein n=1 Tax=bioreactor metagenome TaxID=1076179 RepID=A0A645GKT6_9ZZZZ